MKRVSLQQAGDVMKQTIEGKRISTLADEPVCSQPSLDDAITRVIQLPRPNK